MSIHLPRPCRLLVVLLLLPVACTRIPQPTGYELSEQEKMQSAYHWNVLASDVANQINEELLQRDILDVPLYVRHICEDGDEHCVDRAPFDEAFNDLLTSQLVAFGVPTLREPEPGGLEVDYKVQVLYHRSGRIQVFWPGTLTMLTGLIVALNDAPWETQAVAGAMVGDLLRTTTVVPGHYEVIVSTSIVQDNHYLVRRSDIYYINDQDFWHYQPSTPAAEIELTAGRF